MAENQYISIGKLSKITQIPTYVIRYWEKEFSILKPLRTSSGHRRYTQQHIDILLKIKELLWEKKFTISGAKQFLNEEKKQKVIQLNFELKEDKSHKKLVKEIKKTLEEILKLLE